MRHLGHLVNQLDVSMSFCKLMVWLMYGNIKIQHRGNILFLSAAHRIYSRIDLIFIDKRMLPLLEHVKHVISDHSPVLTTLCFLITCHHEVMWRFNSRLLTDEKFVDFLSNQIDLLF